MSLSTDLHAPFADPAQPLSPLASIPETPPVPVPKRVLFEAIAAHLGLVTKWARLREGHAGLFSTEVKVVRCPGEIMATPRSLVFHGQCMPTSHEALESAYARGIEDMKAGAHVLFDDDNYADLLSTRADLDNTRIWAFILDQKCRDHQAVAQEAAATQARHREHLLTLRERHESILSVKVTRDGHSAQQEAVPRVQPSVDYTGPPVPITDLQRLSSSIVAIIGDLNAVA